MTANPSVNLPSGQPELPQRTPEEDFRNTLDDTILILQKLSPHCTDVDSMVGMLEFALKNDSQLNMIIHLVRPVGLKR